MLCKGIFLFFFREVTLVSSKIQCCILLLETPLSFHRISFLTAFHRCDSFPALSLLLYYSFPLRYLAKKQTCSSESDCLYKPSGAFLFKFDASSLRLLSVLDFSHYLLLKNRKKKNTLAVVITSDTIQTVLHDLLSKYIFGDILQLYAFLLLNNLISKL